MSGVTRAGRLAGLAVALASVAGCVGGTDDPGTVGRPRTTPGVAVTSALPVLPACTLEVGEHTVGLEEAEAVHLTDRAARALRAGVGPDGFARDLAGSAPAEVANRPRAAAAALLGRRGPALSCVHARADLRDQRLGPLGLTPRAARLRACVLDAFGPLPMGGYAAGGVSTGHVDGSSHYEGRAIDILLRPYQDRANAHRGWVLAQWLVARGERLQLLSVIYRDRIWTVWASTAGWRGYVHPSGDTRNPVLRHLDHVHTAVLGGPFRRR